ncbi:MAG: hypothetical protein BRC44_05965, partial [Cyanobacteria bacterium QS_4_48_99]
TQTLTEILFTITELATCLISTRQNQRFWRGTYDKIVKPGRNYEGKEVREQGKQGRKNAETRKQRDACGERERERLTANAEQGINL